MLTKESSNAFLKTLEEPPAHVIFILCTTDPDKLISTVRSRCNIINLRNPSLEELVARLEYIIKSENIILNDKKGDSTNKILNYIASHSNNSFRDSITNLEKVLHTHREKIDKKELEVSDIENIFGKRSVELYMELFAMLTESVSQDKADLIANVKDLENEKNKIIENVLKYCKHNHSDFSYSRMLECFRNGMLIRNKIDISDVECNTVEYKEFVIDNAKLFTSANLLYLLNNSELHNDISDKECVIIAIFGNFVER